MPTISTILRLLHINLPPRPTVTLSPGSVALSDSALHAAALSETSVRAASLSESLRHAVTLSDAEL